MTQEAVFSPEVSHKPISLTREGQIFRLAFPYKAEYVELARSLPFAVFDGDSKSWTCLVSVQAVDLLRQWYARGLTDSEPDHYLLPGEQLRPAAAAVLRAHAGKRPYAVSIGIRSDITYSRLKSIVGAQWDKKMTALTYPAASAAALAEQVAKGFIADPDGVLTPKDGATAVLFDSRSGAFKTHGPDPRAQEAFDKFFPATDVISAWRDKGLDVSFIDEFTEAMYKGELARHFPLPTPEGFKIDLFPHQRVNYSVAVARGGHAVFDEPGLGKSATAIAAGYHLLAAGLVPRVVVVTPASVRTQWAAEITRFSGHEDVVVVAGTPAHRQAAYEKALSSRWLVVHYDVLTRDSKELAPLFAGAFVVADEAHRIKSSGAGRTKALKDLCRSSHSRLALTGTPMETSPEEWFEIISGWALPGSLGSSFEFNERYRWKNRWGGYEGARNITELRDRSKPFYTRHTKAQVAKHLPPLRVQNLLLDPSPAYAAALRRAHADALAEIRAAREQKKGPKDLSLLDGPEADGSEMTSVGLLRLLCSSPRIVQESDSASAKAMIAAGLIPDDDGPKVEELRTMAAGLQAASNRRKAEGLPPTVENVTGERMVVFTFSSRMARLLADRFKEDGVSYVLYTGDTSRKDKDAAVVAFTDPAADVTVFISTDAGAEGLNLGKCCNLLVNADLAWTASKMAQRAQRIHRIDGTAPRYLVVNLSVANTMEAGVMRLLEARADLTDALFGEDGGRTRVSGRGKSSMNLVEQAFDLYDKEHTPRSKKGASKSATPASEQAEDEPPFWAEEDEELPPDEQGAGLSFAPESIGEEPPPGADLSNEAEFSKDPASEPEPGTLF